MGFRLLPIARPCSESFTSMPGGESKRFCASCDKHVHDLSAGTEEDARALFAANRGQRVCVRFAKDAAGNVRFRAAAMATALSLAACGSNPVEAVVVRHVAIRGERFLGLVIQSANATRRFGAFEKSVPSSACGGACK